MTDEPTHLHGFTIQSAPTRRLVGIESSQQGAFSPEAAEAVADALRAAAAKARGAGWGCCVPTVGDRECRMTPPHPPACNATSQAAMRKWSSGSAMNSAAIGMRWNAATRYGRRVDCRPSPSMRREARMSCSDPITDLISPEAEPDFETRRGRWIAETQEMLRLLMERHGMQSEAEPKADTTRVVFVGTIGDRDRAVAAIRESGLARDVLIIGDDVPLCRDRDPATATLRGYDRFAPVVFIEDALSDRDAYVPVRLPDRPRQTKREWRERMKGR